MTVAVCFATAGMVMADGGILSIRGVEVELRDEVLGRERMKGRFPGEVLDMRIKQSTKLKSQWGVCSLIADSTEVGNSCKLLGSQGLAEAREIVILALLIER